MVNEGRSCHIKGLLFNGGTNAPSSRLLKLDSGLFLFFVHLQWKNEA